MSSSKTTISVKQIPKGKTKRKNKSKPKNKTKSSLPNQPQELVSLRAKRQCYVDVLNDPFNNPPCRLGFGTMIPTGLSTAVYRSTLTANADGSLAIFVNPALGTNNSAITAAIKYNNAGLATTTWTSVPWTNQAALAVLSDDLRCVSIGLKVLPLVPATAVPAISYCGALGGLSTNNFIAVSPANISTFQQLQRFICQGELSALGRPVDSDGYAFRVGTYTNYAGTIQDVSVPVIVLTGLPASTSVAVDAICHFEYVPTAQSANMTAFSGNANASLDTLASWFPSFEQMWAYVAPRLRAPGEALLSKTISKGFEYFN